MSRNTDCAECLKLEADRIAKFAEYQNAKDALTMTPKKDVAYFQRNRELKRAIGRLREAGKREDFHREHCRGTGSTNI
jgi:hypothetical protein